MRIAVDAREFTGVAQTGIARYLEGILAPLAAHNEIELTLFASSAKCVPENLSRCVQIIELPKAGTVWIDQVVLPRLTAARGADVFFSPYYKTPLRGAFRKLITVHDIMFLRLASDRPLRRFLAGVQLRWACRVADMVFVDSDFTAQDLIDWIPEVALKTRRVYPDLGAEWFVRPAEAQIREMRSRFALHGPYLLYVGNFKVHKNVDRLVIGFERRLRAGGGRCYLVLAGHDAGAQSWVKDLAGSLGLDGLVRFLPGVSNADLRALYAGAEWLVSASCYEGFGYPMLEAMALGCPVICRNVTSIPEVVNDAFVAIADDTPEAVANALTKALKMGMPSRSALVARGRAQAGRFAPGTAAGQWIKNIKEIIPDFSAPAKRRHG